MGELVAATEEEIRKTRGQISWLEKQISIFELEAATMPTVGYHRPRYLEIKKTLRHLRLGLEAEQEDLQRLAAQLEVDQEAESMMSPETQLSWKEYQENEDRDRAERIKRGREAEKRRASFRLIRGEG